MLTGTTSSTTSSTSTTGTTSTSSTSSSSDSLYSATASASTLGKQDFLTLLVTQLQNQDPLAPTDNTQFVSQLAQFSSLEGITNLNTTMTTMSDNITSMNNYNASSLVGKYVKVPGNQFTYSGSSVVFDYTLASSASSSSATITDSGGSVVKNIDFGSQSSGEYQYTWDGTDNNGNAVATGTYTYTLSATDSNNAAVTTTSSLIGMVDAINMSTTAGESASVSVDGSSTTLDQIQTIY